VQPVPRYLHRPIPMRFSARLKRTPRNIYRGAGGRGGVWKETCGEEWHRYVMAKLHQRNQTLWSLFRELSYRPTGSGLPNSTILLWLKEKVLVTFNPYVTFSFTIWLVRICYRSYIKCETRGSRGGNYEGNCQLGCAVTTCYRTSSRHPQNTVLPKLHSYKYGIFI